MGMRCNTLCFSPHTPSPIKSSPFFFKPSFSCCIKNAPRTPISYAQDLEISRHWVESNSSSPSLSQERFKVVSYNILGDRNAKKHRDLYTLVPSEYMIWDRRKKLICEELIGLDPDIICLQEVDKYYDILRKMEKAGYAGSYKRRTRDSVDGCAMFWKENKIRLLEGENIEFKEFGLRDNVAQISVFEVCKAESRRVLVGNIHVLFRPTRGEIKLGQIRLLLSKAHTLSEKWGNIPVVLAGDFNSTPQSAIYQFLSSSQLDVKLFDRRYLSGQQGYPPSQSGGFQENIRRTIMLMDRLIKNNWTEKEVMTATGTASGTIVEHPLKLMSSYASVKVAKGSARTRNSYGEPLATSFHSKFLGTVDYLWYSGDLVTTRVLDTLPLDILRKMHGLPHEKLGSDHLALVSEFAFKL